jgi:hypothetical protein
VRDTIHITFRLKIEDEIQEINLGVTYPQIIQIDAKFDDWKESYKVYSDPIGDSRGQVDISSVYFTQDEDYLYFMVEYASLPPSQMFLTLNFDANTDKRTDFHLFLSDIYSEIHDWKGTIYGNQGQVIGFSEAIDNNDGIEFRIAKRYLESYLTNSLSVLQLGFFNQDWTLIDDTSIIEIPIEPF